MSYTVSYLPKDVFLRERKDLVLGYTAKYKDRDEYCVVRLSSIEGKFEICELPTSIAIKPGALPLVKRVDSWSDVLSIVEDESLYGIMQGKVASKLVYDYAIMHVSENNVTIQPLQQI